MENYGTDKLSELPIISRGGSTFRKRMAFNVERILFG